LQGLQEIWDMSSVQESWATSGYLGAINSGQTTCGLLIGCSVAIGLRAGKEKTCFPLEDEKERNKAVAAVHLMYEDFLHEFKSTQCQELTECNFSQEPDQERYVKEEVYKNRCFKYFNFIMNRFIEMEKQGV